MIEVKYKEDLKMLFWRENEWHTYDEHRMLEHTDWNSAKVEDIIECYNNWGKTREKCHMHFDGTESLFTIDPLEATKFHMFICSECKQKIPISVMLNANNFLKFCPCCGSKIIIEEEM